MWGFIHVQYLVGWGNRLGTMYTWARALYLSKNRGHRIISFQTTGYEVGGQRILVRSVQPRLPSPQDTPAIAPGQPGASR
jgi:NADH dehydrogenase